MLAKVSKEMFRYNGLRAIYLMLGNRCNLGCSHCHQVYEAEHIDKSMVLSPAMIKFLSLYPGLRVLFWGGEPLCYFEEIKAVVRQMEDAGLTLNYSIHTNGITFSKEHFDYFRAKDFQIIFSYDVPDPTAVRKKKMPDRCVRLLKKYPKTMISFLFCHPNNDIVKARVMLKNKFPDAVLYMGMPVVTCDTNKFLIHFKDGELEKSLGEYIRSCDSGRRWYERWHSDMKLACVCTSGEVLNLDCDGNVYSCHNGNEIVDHISSGYIKIMKTIDSYVKSKELPKCKTCTFRTKCSLCRCKSTVKKGDEYYACSYYRRIYRFVESLSL